MSVVYEGIICSGAGKSSKWMKDSFPNLFPGTVNIKLNNRKPNIHYIDNVDTRYGICYISKCLLNDIEVSIILPPRATLNDYYIEVGYFESLREKMSLKNNDKVSVIFNHIL